MSEPDWNAIRSNLRKQGKDLKPLNAEAAAAMGECFWRQLTGRLAWCEVHGCLREGSCVGEDYRDPDTGKPIRLTSTGYYRPGLAGGEIWEDGPPPSEYLVTLYGEPYKYERPKSYEQE